MVNVVDYYVLDTEGSPNAVLSISRRDISDSMITSLSRIEMFGAGGTGNNDDLKGVLAFSTNTTGKQGSVPEERMRIHKNGYVGIGTEDPKTPLHIPGQGLQIGISPLASNNFHIVSDFTGNARGFRLFNGDNGAGTHLLTVLVDGKVGIGTPTPGAKLEVNGDIKLASIDAPAEPAEGKIYFDKGVKRLRYNDGLQWIQIDPAYTTKKIMWAIGKPTFVNESLPVIKKVLDPQQVDIIITSMSFSLSGSRMHMKIELLAEGEPIATFYRIHEYSNDIGVRTESKDFPIPIKVPAGKKIEIKVSEMESTAYKIIRMGYPCIEYIEFPL